MWKEARYHTQKIDKKTSKLGAFSQEMILAMSGKSRYTLCFFHKIHLTYKRYL
jgi:hypothetical protein